MEEIENGIRITHDWIGHKQIVQVALTDGRLNLSIDDEYDGGVKSVYLNEDETRYLLAQMATWHEQGEAQ